MAGNILFFVLICIGFSVMGNGAIWNYSSSGYRVFKLIFSLAVAMLMPLVVWDIFWDSNMALIRDSGLVQMFIIYGLQTVVFIGFK